MAVKRFTVDAKAVLTLGRNSIKDANTAIVELVKNAYDADAEVVDGDVVRGYFLLSNAHDASQAVRAQFTTSGNPPRGEAKWVAVNGAGFEKRAAPSRQTPQLIGAQVAYDTMTKLR